MNKNPICYPDKLLCNNQWMFFFLYSYDEYRSHLPIIRSYKHILIVRSQNMQNLSKVVNLTMPCMYALHKAQHSKIQL